MILVAFLALLAAFLALSPTAEDPKHATAADESSSERDDDSPLCTPAQAVSVRHGASTELAADSGSSTQRGSRTEQRPSRSPPRSSRADSRATSRDDGPADVVNPATEVTSRTLARTEVDRSLEWARNIDWLLATCQQRQLRPETWRRAISLLQMAPSSPEAPAIALFIASKAAPREDSNPRRRGDPTSQLVRSPLPPLPLPDRWKRSKSNRSLRGRWFS